MAPTNTQITCMTKKNRSVTSTITQLKVKTRNQSLHARVIRKWYRPDYYAPEEHGTIEMLLLDTENIIIQATVRKLIIDRFDPILVEGVAYRLSGFTVSQNTGSEIATPHPFRIYFEFGTLVLQSPNLAIPIYGFSLYEFGDIIANESLNRHFIDVVGHFVGVGDIKQTSGGHPIRTIKLENMEKEQITCSLWGRYTKEIDEYCATQTPSSEPTIIVIQCAQRIIFQGQVRLQTSRYAAKIHINPQIPEVDALKISLMEGNEQVPSRITQITDEDTDTDILSTDNILTIKEIKKCKKAGDYVTLASIDDLDTSIGWYYDSCKICRTKCQLRVDKRWYCKKADCEGYTGGLKTNVPRFQVRYHVVGPLNDCAIFTLFENHIATLVKVSASELLAAQDKPKIPDELAIFIGKKYVFKVRVKQDYNIEQKSRSYTVISMSDDLEVLNQWEKKYHALQDGTNVPKSQTSAELDSITTHTDDDTNNGDMIQSSEAGDTDCQLIDAQEHTPTLKRSVSRMLEAIRDEDGDPQMIDQESATKKTMTIKMEKN